MKPGIERTGPPQQGPALHNTTQATTPESKQESNNDRQVPPGFHRKAVTNQPCQFCAFREATWQSPTGHLVCTQCRLSDIRKLLAAVDDAIRQLRLELCEVGALYIGEVR